MDPLSDVLSQLDAHSSFFAGLEAGGDWAIRFPAPDGIKFNAVIEGSCWLVVEDELPVLLLKGDCFLLSKRRPFTLASDLEIEPVESQEVYRDAKNGIARYQQRSGFFLIGGRFGFCEEARLLFDGLPAAIVVNGESDQACVLQWALLRLASELPSTLPGASLIVRQLGHMMLVHVLRLYLSSGQVHSPGWLMGLSDLKVNAAIQAIHAAPQRRWTVHELARVVGMSRSTLALRFKQKVGMGPLAYVLQWRMQLAGRELRKHQGSISSIGQSLGYDSDSAFSNAFKRVMACSPREYRERQSQVAGVVR
ncbi:AraC family transcriptional regulator [Pseudomonas sp. MAFF 730085]|uniref:AraC family transcriptional regulator n=1 Tax=Pseudomonas kitaguniensis TaxID=2607908 RepID=A0A5N7JZF6_9PSED|nr:AraC family transcriptional regulator [Pseudomonas kitaguniensis]MPQ86778.1 AraC family transcriptional regulator [Pseudomonas kitaguniensis]